METEKNIGFLKKMVLAYFSFWGKKKTEKGYIKCSYFIIFMLGVFNTLFILGGWIAIAYLFDILFNFKEGYVSSLLTFVTWVVINVIVVYLLPCKYEDETSD